MKLFSESVNLTNTSFTQNILKVEDYKEIFFDVFEVKINRNTYPLEKIADYNGNPVVMVPIVLEDKEQEYPFILLKGKQEIVFNEKNTEIPVFYKNDDNFINIEADEAYDSLIQEKTRKQLSKQIETAKNQAIQYAEKVKREKLLEAQKEISSKKKALQNVLAEARTSLVKEFHNISDALKSELFANSQINSAELKLTINNRIEEISENLENTLKNDLDNFSSVFDKNLKDLIKEMYDTSIKPKVEEELTNIAKTIVEKVDTIDTKLINKLKGKVDIQELKDVSEKVGMALKGNVELNDTFNKKVNKALSRIGQLDNKVSQNTLTILESLDSKIDLAISEIDRDYTERISNLEEQTFNITDEVKKYLISVIEESRNNLVSEIRKLKTEKPIEYIIESNGKKEVKNWDKLEKDWDKKIHDKFENYKVDLRKYISVYASGGGTNAVQYANGGVIDGNLIINGSLSATNYLGVSGEASSETLDSITTRGNATNNSISINTLSAKSVQLDTSTNIIVNPGQLAWNSEDVTMDLGLNNEVTLQVGQEQLVRIKVNQTGGLVSGMPVYASATTGGSDNIEVSRFSANASFVDEIYFIGIATEDLNDDEIGFITTFGRVRGVDGRNYGTGKGIKDPADSNTWQFGTVLYISPNIAGTLTSIIPTAPDKRMPVAMVLKVPSITNITLMVRSEHGYHLNELHDVKIENLSANQVLSYNSSLSTWQNTSDLNIRSISASKIQTASGSALDPSYSFIGDSNTGIFSSASDTLNFSTNGIERIKIDSTGKVGIGADPSTGAHVLNVGGGFKVGAGGEWFSITTGTVVFNSQGGTCNIGAGSTAFGASINIAPISDSTPLLSMRGSATQDVIRISSPAAITGDYAIIKADGKVGVGTTSPKTPFHTAAGTPGITYTPNVRTVATFENAGNFGSAIAITALSTKTANIWFGTQGNETSGQITFDSSTNAFSFYNNGATRLTLNSSGNLGVGTTTPTYKTEVAGSGATDGIRSHMGFDIYPVTAPAAGSVTGVVSSGGSVDTGTHYYAVTYTTSTGETTARYSAAIETTAGNNTVTLTIPVSTDPRVTGRKIYRTKSGASIHQEYLLATIANNVDTTYIDTAADSTLPGLPGVVYYKTNTTSNGISVNGTRAITLDSNGVFIGIGSGANLTTGGRNTLVGSGAGLMLSTGSDNAFCGMGAGQNQTSASTSTFIGTYAGHTNTTGSGNTALGGYALFSNQTGTSNTCVGTNAGQYIIGGSNTAIGRYSLLYNTTGTENIAIGASSGQSIASGSNNVTPSASIYIGYDTRALSAGGTNEIVIGGRAVGNGSNTVTIGNSSITKTILAGNVGIGTTTPNEKLTVSGNISATGTIYSNTDVEITSIGRGIIMRSPNNTRWRITVTDSGTLSSTQL